MLVLLITSDSLTGKFGFDSNSQVQQASSGAFSTDVMKRTSIYFTFILYSTAVLALIRYFLLTAKLTTGLLDVWYIYLNWASYSAVEGNR